MYFCLQQTYGGQTACIPPQALLVQQYIVPAARARNTDTSTKLVVQVASLNYGGTGHMYGTLILVSSDANLSNLRWQPYWKKYSSSHASAGNRHHRSTSSLVDALTRTESCVVKVTVEQCTPDMRSRGQKTAQGRLAKTSLSYMCNTSHSAYDCTPPER